MEEENIFNINSVLKDIVHSLGESCTKEPDVVFVFSKHVPRMLKGNVTLLAAVLHRTLREILSYDCSQELIFSVDAPEDFLYKEPVTFTIMNLPFKKEDILRKLQNELSKELDTLGASLQYVEEHGGSIEITVPFSTAKLGNRRHYRLPNKEMLENRILLIIDGNSYAVGLSKMLKYFPITVDLSLKRFKEEKYDLKEYALVIVEKKLYDKKLQSQIAKAQEEGKTKLVLFCSQDDIEEKEKNSESSPPLLKKPVTQESVYQLLIDMLPQFP